MARRHPRRLAKGIGIKVQERTPVKWTFSEQCDETGSKQERLDLCQPWRCVIVDGQRSGAYHVPYSAG